MLDRAGPETYFRPAVRRPPRLARRPARPWDRADELAGVVEDAYAEVAPPRLLAEAGLLDDG